MTTTSDGGTENESRFSTTEEIERARAQYGGNDVEVDDDAEASEGSEGVWVHAWVRLGSGLQQRQIRAPVKKFDPKRIKETLAQCDALIANYHKQIATMGELKRSLVHECTKHFDDPEVRAAFIEIRLAELAARGMTVDERSQLKYIDAKKHARMLQWDGELEHIAKQIKAAREYVVGQQEQGV